MTKFYPRNKMERKRRKILNVVTLSPLFSTFHILPRRKRSEERQKMLIFHLAKIQNGHHQTNYSLPSVNCRNFSCFLRRTALLSSIIQDFAFPPTSNDTHLPPCSVLLPSWCDTMACQKKGIVRSSQTLRGRHTQTYSALTTIITE